MDVVFENIGDPDLWPGAWDSLARNGRLVTVGFHGGGIVPLDIKKLHMRQLKVLSSAMDAGSKDVQGRLFAACCRGKNSACHWQKITAERMLPKVIVW